MKNSTIIRSLVLAAVAGANGVALAGDVDMTKSRDSHVKVWNTFLGSRYGDPIHDGDLAAGDNLKISAGWITDLSVEQKFLTAQLNTTSTTGLAAVVGTPGSFTMPNLESAVMGLAGNSRIAVPDFASSFFDVFVTIDLDDYVLGGGHSLPIGSNWPSNNGHIPGMPGVTVGLAPFTFDPATGWTTPVLFTGQLECIGEMGLTAPAPGSLALLGLGGMCLSRRRR